MYSANSVCLIEVLFSFLLLVRYLLVFNNNTNGFNFSLSFSRDKRVNILIFVTSYITRLTKMGLHLGENFETVLWC